MARTIGVRFACDHVACGRHELCFLDLDSVGVDATAPGWSVEDADPATRKVFCHEHKTVTETDIATLESALVLARARLVGSSSTVKTVKALTPNA